MKRRAIIAGLGWAVLLGAGLACGLALTRWFHPWAPAIVRELPPGETLGYLNLGPLRAAGVLATAVGGAQRAPSYAAFVRESGFDFERDLDAVALSLEGAPLQPEQASCILAGRFGAKFQAYLAAHATRRVQVHGQAGFQFPGWARPQQAMTVVPLDAGHVLVSNAPAPEMAAQVARAQSWRPASPALWQAPVWSRPELGYVAVDAQRLAALRQLDGSQPPWRGARAIEVRIEAGLDGGVTLEGKEQAASAADAAAALAWAQQMLGDLRRQAAATPASGGDGARLGSLLDQVQLRQQGDQVALTLALDAATLRSWRSAGQAILTQGNLLTALLQRPRR